VGNKPHADPSEWLAEIVNSFVGFFFLLLNNSITWGILIIGSCRQAASSAGGVGLAPVGCSMVLPAARLPRDDSNKPMPPRNGNN